MALHIDRSVRVVSCYRIRLTKDGSKLVAFAKWKYPYTLTPSQRAEKAKLDLGRSYPPGTNSALYDQFFGHLDTLRKKYLDEEKDYCESPIPFPFIYSLLLLSH